MGPEHFENNELNQVTEHVENLITDRESERPLSTEVPQLEYSKYEVGGRMEWRAADSERESVELPQLEERGADREIKKEMYYSTYEERLKQTPREDSDRGEWSGERGESDFIANDEEVRDILEQYDKESIPYEDAIPDFSEVAESTVEIDYMTENRADNFRQCDEKCAEQWNQESRDERNDWTAREVKEWRQENGYSWHERNDMKTCDLIPTKVNDYFGHLGGVSECKKRDTEIGGSDFDE